MHDFMVNDDGDGPTSAALWMLFGLLYDPDAALLSPSSVCTWIRDAGLVNTREYEVIPTITRMITVTCH